MPQTKINLCQADYEGSTSGFVSDEELAAASGHLQAQIAPSSLFVKRDGTTPLTANWDVGGFEVQDAGVVAVQSTAPSSPPVGRLWLDTGTSPSGAPQTLSIRAVSSLHFADLCDTVIIANSDSGVFSIVLPEPSGATVGKTYYIKKVDSSSNAITIEPSGSATIDGQTNLDITTQYDSYTVISDGSSWWII